MALTPVPKAVTAPQIDEEQPLQQDAQHPQMQVVEASGLVPGEDSAQVDAIAFRRLSDLMILPASQMHPQERLFAIDMLQSALPTVGADLRQRLAERLAGLDNVAPALVSRLVVDEDIEVARPLLTRGAMVSDNDLRAVLALMCPQRSTLVARRPTLSPQLTAEIARSQEKAVVIAALRNPRARFATHTIAAIAQRACREPDLAEPVLARPEVSPACALDMFWGVPGEQRLYILDRFLEDSQIVNQILEIGHERDRNRLFPQCVSPDAAGGAALTASMHHTKHQERLLQVAHDLAEGKLGDAAERLTYLAAIASETARRILCDPLGEPLAVAFKAAGASRATFAQSLDVLGPSDHVLPEDAATRERLGVLFDQLSRGHARMATTYWNWRELGVGPYAASDEVDAGDASFGDTLY